MPESTSRSSDTPRKLSPMTVLAGGFFGFLILIVVLIGVASLFDKEPAPENVLEPLLASQTMPDGSKLIVKAATLGTTHELTQRYPRQENSMFNAMPNEARMSTSVSAEYLGLWFEQFAMPSLEVDDFSWWMRSSVLDEAGKEIFDVESSRFIEYQYGSSSEMGSRPYSPADRTNRPQIIAAVAYFPMFRNSHDTLTVRIYGSDPKPVAEFEIPNPMKAKSFPVWTPEPLPASKTISGVTMTLEEVKYIRKQYASSATGAVTYQFQLKPSYTVSESGKIIEDGIVDPYQVSDALGNQGGNFNPGLPLEEAAWKLTVPWRHNPRTVTGAGKFDVSGELNPVSAEKTPDRLSEALRCRTSQVSLLAIGAGEQTMRNLIPPTSGNWSTSTSAEFAGEYHGVDFDRDERGSELQITSTESWLVVRTARSPSDRVDLLLLGPDDQILESKAIDAGELTVLIFQAPEGPVRLKAVVQEAIPFEFTFAPPEVVDE